MLSLNGRIGVSLRSSEFRADDVLENTVSSENSRYFRLEKQYGDNEKCKNILDSVLIIRKEIESDDSIESRNCGKQIAWIKASDKIIKEISLSEEEFEYVDVASKYIFREHSLATMGLIGLLGL